MQQLLSETDLSYSISRRELMRQILLLKNTQKRSILHSLRRLSQRGLTVLALLPDITWRQEDQMELLRYGQSGLVAW